MRLPAIHGIIRRRILVNYRVDPEVARAQLPAPFAPKLHEGRAIAGVCLIRLEAIRPRPLPALFGLSSENAAHRIAVTWDGGSKEGVFIPRRDTDSTANHLLGGRLFPGEHHRAAFTVRESSGSIEMYMRSHDGATSLRLRGRPGGTLPATSRFPSLEAASAFFRTGSLGYSATGQPERLDGMELRTHGWHVEPFQIDDLHAGWFEDRARFPEGSVAFDSALIMRNLSHEWHRADDFYV